MKESDLYLWPSDFFPFRHYLNHDNCRIFIIENIEHNYKWLKEVKDEIKETDYFFVLAGWFFDESAAKKSKFTIESLGLNPKQFFILFNSHEENIHGFEYGLHGDLINQNAWLDERKFKILNVEKKYNALYTARRSAFKRHFLCSKINGLALAAGGNNHGKDVCEIPDCMNDPNKKYDRTEMVSLINESACGLCLSEVEGACFSSSEYLLCGVPVVSTQSQGGRDFWYNINNSIITESDPDDVAKAVSRVKGKYFNAKNIRETHIKQMVICRIKLIKVLSDIFEKHKVEINAGSFFENNFYEKMRKSKHYNEVINIFKG